MRSFEDVDVSYVNLNNDEVRLWIDYDEYDVTSGHTPDYVYLTRSELIERVIPLLNLTLEEIVEIV